MSESIAESLGLMAPEEDVVEVLGVNTSRPFVCDASLPSRCVAARTTTATARRRFVFFYSLAEYSNGYKPPIHLIRFLIVVR